MGVGAAKQRESETLVAMRMAEAQLELLMMRIGFVV